MYCKFRGQTELAAVVCVLHVLVFITPSLMGFSLPSLNERVTNINIRRLWVGFGSELS